MIEAEIGEREDVGRELFERIEEEPLDEGVEATVLLQDVQHVVIPPVLADQAAPPFRCDWRRTVVRSAGETRRPLGVDRDHGAVVHDVARPVGVPVVDDEGIAERTQLHRRATAGGREVQASVALVELHCVGSFAVRPGQTPRELRIDRIGTRTGHLGQRLTSPDRQHHLEGRIRDPPHDRARTVHRRHDDHSDPDVREEGELGGEAVNGTAVTEPPLPPTVLHTEAEPVPRGGPRRRELWCPHLLERLALEDATVRSLTTREHRLHEQAEIEHRRVHAPGRRHAELEGGRLEERAVEAPHVRARQLVHDVGPGRERAARHPERIQHGGPHVIRERLAFHDLEHVPDHGDARVRVLGAPGRIVDQLRRSEAGDRLGEGRARVVEVVARRWLSDEARPVGHQLPQRDRRGAVVGDSEVREVLADRGIEVERAPFDELHHGDVREELGDRSDPVHRLRSSHRPRVGIGGAASVRPSHAPLVDEGDRHRPHPLLRPLPLDHLLEGQGHLAPLAPVPGEPVVGRRAATGGQHDAAREEELGRAATPGGRHRTSMVVETHEPHP